jgi:hypothetical protein
MWSEVDFKLSFVSPYPCGLRLCRDSPGEHPVQEYFAGYLGPWPFLGNRKSTNESVGAVHARGRGDEQWI